MQVWFVNFYINFHRIFRFHDQLSYFISYTSLCIILHKISVRNMWWKLMNCLFKVKRIGSKMQVSTLHRTISSQSQSPPITPTSYNKPQLPSTSHNHPQLATTNPNYPNPPSKYPPPVQIFPNHLQPSPTSLNHQQCFLLILLLLKRFFWSYPA